jgi:energy-coupling factor transport system substrate-specific component
MSWQLGAFGLLAVALAAGFGWYERTRPDARVVALVGTLAAFAALGRIAFAALPNVKPTTDIVLIAGFALGGAPGFVVGAVAALTSNFFFGQGPWTVWQMAGWAAVGLLGAGLGSVTRGRVGRWPLAVVCGVIGFAFTAFQDFGDWINYSGHSAGELGLYVGKGLGFDAIHAAGCVAFALLFGPALVRSVARFAARLQVTWERAPSGVVAPVPVLMLVLCVAALAGVAGLGVASPARAGGSPTTYLLGAQNGDGGYGPAPGQASSSMYAAWAALGLESVGVSPANVRHGGPSLLSYVENTTSPGDDPGALERAILVERAAGAGAGGLVGALAGRFGGDGSVSEQVNLTAFGVLALRAAGAGLPPGTVGWLARQENRDGGFSFATAGAPSDIDDTGAALEALAAGGGAPGSALARGVGYLRAQQNSDGGFPQQSGALSNAQSTAWAIQGLIAAGVDPGSLRRGGHSPVDYLRSLVAPDGHVRYAAGSDQTPVWVTGEALMALAGKPLPLPSVSAPARASGRRRTHVAKGGTPAVAAAAALASHHTRARAHRTVAPAPPPAVQRLAGDVGLATAVLLAPVGVS